MSFKRRSLGLIAIVLALAIAQALVTGTTHSRYSVIHRVTEPGMFWGTIIVALVIMALCMAKFVSSGPSDRK